jgi:NTE family protein
MPEPRPQFPDEGRDAKQREGIALCLSGGGYRAMVFHLGVLHRLNEAGLLPKLARISSVSGGSITAGALGLSWKQLSFDADGRATNFNLVAHKIQDMADTTIDVGAIIGGILMPGSISKRVAKRYADVLFGEATLQDLPDSEAGEGPRFVINATNVQSGVLWRFSRPYMGDYRVGLFRNPRVRLADAVAASSAFPPVLSPTTIDIREPVEVTEGADLARPPYTEAAVLSDGGVYDNLGLETAFKRCTTLLVSDAGQKTAEESAPAEDWARHSIRILDLVDNQVRSLRKRTLIESYVRGDHSGTYWGIRTHYRDYELPADADPLGCAGRDPAYLAATPTRLEEMPRKRQRQLANWGYAICDAALRKHFGTELQQKYGVTIGMPAGFPYPDEY